MKSEESDKREYDLVVQGLRRAAKEQRVRAQKRAEELAIEIIPIGKWNSNASETARAGIIRGYMECYDDREKYGYKEI